MIYVQEQLELDAYPLSYWARKYGICERTLRNAISSGRLRCLRFGRAIRITPQQFSDYVESLEG